MKSKLLAIAAIMLALVSCKKEPVSKNNYVDYDADAKVISVKCADGSEYKWKTGDLINVWFDSNKSQLPDLVLKCVGENWIADRNAPVSGAKPAESGNFKAFHFSDNPDLSTFKPEISGSSLYLRRPEAEVFAAPLIMDARSQTYSFDAASNVLSIEIKEWNLGTELRLAVVNDDGLLSSSFPMKAKANGRTLKCSYGIAIDDNYVLPLTGQHERLLGFREGGKVVFYFDDAYFSKSTDIEFTLIEENSVRKYTLPSFKYDYSTGMVNVEVKHSDFK